MSSPEVDPEDLKNHGEKAKQHVYDLQPGEAIRWADAVNTQASMTGLENGEVSDTDS